MPLSSQSSSKIQTHKMEKESKAFTYTRELHLKFLKEVLEKEMEKEKQLEQLGFNARESRKTQHKLIMKIALNQRGLAKQQSIIEDFRLQCSITRNSTQ